MATENRLWGAERIRGELLKLDIQVCKRTIQKYMSNVRTPRPKGQRWATFLHNHAKDIWACDFLQVTDLFFRPLFAFFIVELRVTASGSCRRYPLPSRCLGGATAKVRHPLWASAEVLDL
jgi:hypothetical protein